MPDDEVKKKVRRRMGIVLLYGARVGCTKRSLNTKRALSFFLLPSSFFRRPFPVFSSSVLPQVRAINKAIVASQDRMLIDDLLDKYFNLVPPPGELDAEAETSPPPT